MPYHARDANAVHTKRLGIKFRMADNYPSPDIVGHYYVYGDRTFERTVLDKGFLAPLSGNNASNENSPLSSFMVYKYPRRSQHLPTTDGDGIGPQAFIPLYAYISANTLFNEKFPKGTYMTVEKYYYNPTIDEYVDEVATDNDRYDQNISVNTAHLQHKE